MNLNKILYCTLQMFKSVILFDSIIMILVTLNIGLVRAGSMPAMSYDNETTTCEEFSRFARFNPYSVVNDEWMSFYYWGPPRSPLFAIFFVPTTRQKEYLKYLLDGHVMVPVDWTARMLMMRERDNSTYLLVEQDDRGRYLLYATVKGMKVSDIVDAIDIRFKQVSDGKYFGIFDCQRDMVYMFSRLNDIPKKDQMSDVAAMLGYRGRGGKSYLYQGHQWMPIPEADEEDFWIAMKHRRPTYRE